MTLKAKDRSTPEWQRRINALLLEVARLETVAHRTKDLPLLAAFRKRIQDLKATAHALRPKNKEKS